LWGEYYPVAEYHRYVKNSPLFLRRFFHSISTVLRDVFDWERFWELEHVASLFTEDNYYNDFMRKLCTYRHFTDEMQKHAGKTLKNKICWVSGSGNVAIHTIEKLYKMGAKPITCSDSKGTIYDPQGINLELLKDIKLTQRVSLEEYSKSRKEATYVKKEAYPKGGHEVWKIPCDYAFPCATQNELTLIDAKNLIKNKIQAVTEGANMPCTPDAIKLFLRNKVLFAPAKAANAGGVVVSEFEMSQNAAMVKWSYEKVDQMLEETMRSIFKRIHSTAKEYGFDGNYMHGANIEGFKRAAEAMIGEGI
jgi:glutamate dehydrogenase (NADP+)